MRTRNKFSRPAIATALASPLLVTLTPGCEPAPAPEPGAQGAGLAAAALADGACEPLKTYDARFAVTATRHYEDSHVYDPDGPSCEVTTRDETSSARYHLFWKDTGYYLSLLGEESTHAVSLDATGSPTLLTFGAELDNLGGYEVFDLCPEYGSSPYNDWYNYVQGTLQGQLDLVTGALSFARQCRVEVDATCGGYDFTVDEAAEGAHACEPSNADPLPVACAPLTADDLANARLHVIGTAGALDGLPTVECSSVLNYTDFDATFALHKEGEHYLADLFAIGQHRAIPLTTSSQTATELALEASEEGGYPPDAPFFFDICPEFDGYPVSFPGHYSGGLEVRVDLSTGAVSHKRTCVIDNSSCDNDHMIFENGQGAFVCPPP